MRDHRDDESGSGSESDSDDSDDSVSGKRVKITRPISPYLANYANIAANAPSPFSCLPSGPPQPTRNLKDLRILVIEDSIFQRKLIVRGLMKCLGEEMTDYEDKWPVVSIGNGEEAFKLLESQRYDIFIVDENLDGTGGILKGHEVYFVSFFVDLVIT